MLHSTKQLSPALRPPQLLTSYASPSDANAAHPEIAVHVGRRPVGFALMSVFSDPQLNVAPAAEPT